MRCEEVRNRLGAFIDGESDIVEGGRIQQHLEQCSGCREELAALREVGSLLAEERIPAMPGGFRSKVLVAAEQALEGRGKQESGPFLDLPTWWRQARPALRVAAAAALALGVGLGILLGVGSMGPVPEVPGSSPVVLADPYEAHYLSANPAGSLPQVYVAMASQLDRGGE
jgi:anti-sigma factor RsiW